MSMIVSQRHRSSGVENSVHLYVLVIVSCWLGWADAGGGGWRLSLRPSFDTAKPGPRDRLCLACCSNPAVSKQRLCNEAKSVCNNSELRQHPCRIYILVKKSAVGLYLKSVTQLRVRKYYRCGEMVAHTTFSPNIGWTSEVLTEEHQQKSDKQPRSPDQIATITRSNSRNHWPKF